MKEQSRHPITGSAWVRAFEAIYVTAWVEAFEAFYAVMRAEKQRILIAGDKPDAPSAESVRITLLARLDAFAAENGAEGTHRNSQRIADAQYVMAALADEHFLGFEWAGRRAWRDDLLETALFRTREAGQRFFVKLDALIAEGGNDAATRQLGLVYLFALNMGFRGRYARGEEGDRELARYRRDLYAALYGGEPSFRLLENQRLCPAAYDHTRTGRRDTSISTRARWTLAALLVAVLYLLISHVAWTAATGGLDGELDTILGARPAAGDSASADSSGADLAARTVQP